MPHKIDKKEFLTISKQIKEDLLAKRYNVPKLAKKYSFSVSTIRMIRRAGTYPNFLAMKAARNTSRKTTPAETELSGELKKLEEAPSEYVTLKQFNDAVATLSADVSNAKSVANIANGKASNAVNMSSKAQASADRAEKQEQQNSGFLRAIMQRKPRWFERVQVETSDR
jgi:esterase/lipase